MKTIVSTILIVLSISNVFAQKNSYALQLAKLFYSDEVEQRKKGMQQIASQEELGLSESDFSTEEIYLKIASVHSELFTEEEIQRLLEYETSSVKQKQKKLGVELNQKYREILVNWERDLVFEKLKQKWRVLAEREQSEDGRLAKSGKGEQPPRIRDSEALKKMLSNNPELLQELKTLIDFLNPEEFEFFFNAKIDKNQ